MKSGRTLLIAGLAVLGGLVPIASHAQSVAAFYRGKTIRMIVGTPSGEGLDNWSRLLARAISAHLPGNPTIVVEQMPGGGTVVAANYLYNLAAKDGTVFGTFSRNLPAEALMGRANVRYDPRQFGWLGSPESSNRACFANTSAAVQKAEDLFTKELVVGGAGSGTVLSFLPRLLDNLLGMKFRVVEGYPGSGAVFLAMDTREVDGLCITLSQFTGPRSNLLSDGKVRILFNTENKPLAQFPEVPTIYRFIHDEEKRQIIAFINSSLELGRPYAAPPGVPAERLAALRTAFAEATADTTFLAEAARLKYTVTYTSSAEQEQTVAALYRTPPDLLAKAAALMPAN